MSDLEKQLIFLREVVRIQQQNIVGLRRSLIEARTIIVNECGINEDQRQQYLDWLCELEEEIA